MSDSPRRPGRVQEVASVVEGLGPRLGPETTALPQTAPRDDTRAPGRISDNAVSLADDAADAAPPPMLALPPQASSPWPAVWSLLGLTVAGWLAVETVTSLVALWQTTPWLGGALGLVTGAFVITLLLAGRRELRALRRVDALQLRANRIASARQHDDLPALRAALAETLANLRTRYPQRMAEFDAAAAARHTTTEYLQLLENLVLGELDREADAAIRRAALTVGSAVAIVPHPAFDAAVVLWRATRLTREIGDIYGLAPTGWSAWRLLKHTLASALLAAGLEQFGSIVVDEVGRGTLENAGKRLAEGAVTATRLQRLGAAAKRLCRPLLPGGALVKKS